MPTAGPASPAPASAPAGPEHPLAPFTAPGRSRRRLLVVADSDATIAGPLGTHLAALRSDGWEIHVAAELDDRIPPGLVTSAHHVSFGTVALRHLAPGAGAPRAAKAAIRDVISRVGPDVVECHDVAASAVTRLAAPRSLLTLAVCPDLHPADGSRLPLRFERLLQRRTGGIITCTTHDRQEATTVLGYEPGRVWYVPGFGVDVAGLQQRVAVLRPPTRLRSGPEVVAMVGDLVPRNRPELALGAFAAVPGDAELWVAGDGPLADAMRRAATTLGVAGRVRSFPAREDRAELWAEADLLLHCSTGEGVATAAIEAQACGVPVVAFDVRGVHDAVHGSPSWIRPEGATVEAVAEAVTAGLRLRRGAPRPEVAARFSTTATVEAHRRALAAADLLLAD